MRRARARGDQADLRIVLYDCTKDGGPDDETLALVQDGMLVASKSDLVENTPHQGLAVSTKTGQGIDVLLDRLAGKAAQFMTTGGLPGLTRLRHRQGLEDCRDALCRALEETESELLAEDVRVAARHLGRIIGRVDVEDILEVVFADFCIGK